MYRPFNSFRLLAISTTVFLLLCLPATAHHRSHSSRASKGARAERSSHRRHSREHGQGKRSSRRHEQGRDRSGRRRGRRGREEYASHRLSRHGRRRYYESRESYSTPPRPVSSGIPPERVTEIQKSLVKAGYLEGAPTGQYDQGTIDAMKNFQRANGFTATGLPSASALKKLGVSKRSEDNYAVSVKKATETEAKPSLASPPRDFSKPSTSPKQPAVKPAETQQGKPPLAPASGQAVAPQGSGAAPAKESGTAPLQNPATSPAPAAKEPRNGSPDSSAAKTPEAKSKTNDPPKAESKPPQDKPKT
ncbi:MAG TPA: peptidoglycan-binding protein [Blastocatellia bacterium]|nr:peptidoglycan-binding protein [Blastocatellia bacterium]